MPNAADNIRANLLASAKKHFLSEGYEGASLRSICRDAHVTTGALYSNFTGKAGLFRALVEDDLADYLVSYELLFQSLLGCLPLHDSIELQFMDYLYDRRNLFKLLFDCSTGTPYERFKENLIERFVRTYQHLFDVHAATPVRPEVTRIVVLMKFAQYCELLFGDYTKEQVQELMRTLQILSRAEFKALMTQVKDSP